LAHTSGNRWQAKGNPQALRPFFDFGGTTMTNKDTGKNAGAQGKSTTLSHSSTHLPSSSDATQKTREKGGGGKSYQDYNDASMGPGKNCG
jgi:hypothetical protein